MRKFFIKVTHSSVHRGYNRTVTVYTQDKDGEFNFVGENAKINTASYRGDTAVASLILHDEFNFKWDKNYKNYNLLSKSVRLIFLP